MSIDLLKAMGLVFCMSFSLLLVSQPGNSVTPPVVENAYELYVDGLNSSEKEVVEPEEIADATNLTPFEEHARTLEEFEKSKSYYLPTQVEEDKYTQLVLEAEDDKRTSKYTTNSGYEVVNMVIEDDIIRDWATIEDFVYEVCNTHENLRPALVYGVIMKESCCQSDAYSSAKCVGLMQLNPKYYADRMEVLGCKNLFDPYENIIVACDYLNELIGQYGEDMALRVYNYGPDALRGIGQGSTSKYVKKVMKFADEWETLYSDNYIEFTSL